MTRMTRPDCAVMCNLINIHTYIYEVLLYSSLYLFEYSCFHLNSGTVHRDIVHRNRKRALLSQSTVPEEPVEKSAR